MSSNTQWSVYSNTVTQTQLKFFEEVIAYFDEGSQWRFCTSILVKAFNKVPHKRLVTKVKAHGTGSNIWRRIEAWLSDRSQRVVINGHASGWETLTQADFHRDRYFLLLGPTRVIICEHKLH